MLEEIAVENLVIIDRVHVEFHSGFNAISGETGVGKSLLLRAINILLGGRLKPHEPAQGTCRIEGRFRVDPSTLGESFMGFASDDPTEWVVRVLKNAGGKQRCYINGAMASRREVTKLGHLLADIQGQDDRQRLLAQLALDACSCILSWASIATCCIALASRSQRWPISCLVSAS